LQTPESAKSRSGGSPAPPSTAPRRPRPAGQTRLAFAVFAVGLALTAAAFVWSLAHEAGNIRKDLLQRGVAAGASIQREVARRVEMLDAVASFVVVTGGNNRPDLRNYLSDLTHEQAGSVVLDWAPRVAADSLKAHEERQWLQGTPDFHVHRGAEPLPPASEYLPLHFGVGAGARVDGMDLTSGSDLSGFAGLSEALASSRSNRKAAAAAPVRLVRPEGTRAAVPFVTPVRTAKGAVRSDGDGDHLGYVVGFFDIDAIARDAMSDAERTAVSVELRDVTTGGGATPLFVQRATRVETDGALLPLWNVVGSRALESVSAFDLGGRRWAVTMAAGPLLIAAHLTLIPWMIVAAGLVLSVAMATTANGYATRGAGLASARKRLANERRDFLEKMSRMSDDLEREKLDRRRTEESLFREKQQFRLMFNAVPAMICYKDTKNRFLLVNESAAASMGRTVEEMEGKPCSEIVPARAYELYRDDLEIIQTGKPKLGLVEETESPSGGTVWTRTDKLPEYDAMGRVVGILVFSQDITGHREAEAEVRRLNEELEQRVGVRTAELRAANQELESFAYSVSHDLRTPLRTIDGFSKLLLEEYGPALPSPALDYLKRLRGAAQRMGHLIDDLLKLTRVSRAEIRHEQVDLSALARRTVDDLRRTTPDRRVDVVIEATPFATGDPELLASVVQNLVGNAWKFTGQNPEARIEFGSRTVDGDRTAYYVRDNGVGFDMVYADKLFGAFQRLHSHEEFEGSGIGLATVQMIIRRHAGEVWADSQPDQGTTFQFTLGSAGR